MLERTRGGAEQAELDSPVPHFYLSLLAAVLAHQVGLGMQAFEVAADSDRFGKVSAIVELDEGQPTRGILCEHLRRAIFPRRQIDLLSRNLESLFRNEDSEPSRIRREREVIYFHNGCNLKPSAVRVNLSVSSPC